MARDDKARRQSQFIEQYLRFLVVQDACDALEPKLARSTFESWRRNDVKFREKLAEADARISDDIKRIALKASGVLPWTLEEKSRGAGRMVNSVVLNKLLGKVQEFKEKENVTPVINFPVIGVDAKTLAKLITPDPNDPNKDVEAPKGVQPEIDPLSALNSFPPSAENGEEPAAPEGPEEKPDAR